MVEGIAPEVEHVFAFPKLGLVYSQLQRVGFSEKDVQALMAMCWAEHKNDGKSISESSWFLLFGQRVINPILNERLGRTADHPTFNNLLAYALRDYIFNDRYAQELSRITPRNQLFKIFEGKRNAS